MASTDDVATNRAFAERNGATFPILSDVGGDVSRAYGVLSSSGMARRWTYYIAPDGTIAHIDHAVDPRTAGTELVANLQRLGVPEQEPEPLPE